MIKIINVNNRNSNDAHPFFKIIIHNKNYEYILVTKSSRSKCRKSLAIDLSF